MKHYDLLPEQMINRMVQHQADLIEELTARVEKLEAKPKRGRPKQQKKEVISEL